MILIKLPSFLCNKKTNLNVIKLKCKNKYFCSIAMLTSSEDTKILNFNPNQKSDKASFIIYADLECQIEKIDECGNNPKN